MKYNITKSENYSFATIVPKETQTVSALISVDTHSERTVADQAVELMYSDALLSGTDKYTRDEFLNAINLLGASIGVSVNDSIVTFSLKSRGEEFPKLVRLFTNMLEKPAFKKTEMNRIQRTVVNALNQSREDSKNIAHIELRNSFYGRNDRKYTFPIDDTISDVSRVATKNLTNLHSRVMNQSWSCTVAGEKKYCDLLDSAVSKLKRGVKSSEILGLHQQKPPKPGVTLEHIPSRANIDFSIGAPLPITLHHPDYLPLSLGLAVLAKWGGFSGRLMSTVRELEGLTYGIYGKLEGFNGYEQGYWRIMTFFAPEKALQGLTSTFREIKTIYQKGITQTELDKFKTIINTSQALLNDSVSGLLGDLHAYHCNDFSLEEMRERKAQINQLTLAEVNNAIKTYLNPSTLTVSGAGPTQAVQNELKKFIKTV